MTADHRGWSTLQGAAHDRRGAGARHGGPREPRGSTHGPGSTEAFLQALVQNVSDVVMMVDHAGWIRWASPSSAQVLGFPGRAGRPLVELLPAHDRQAFSHMLELLRVGDPSAMRDYWWMVRGDRTPVKIELSCSSPLRLPGAHGLVLVLTLHDVTAEHEQEHEPGSGLGDPYGPAATPAVGHRAFHDPLTGLVGRALLLDRVDQALTESVREGTVIGLLLIDIDDFAAVNDAHGHDTGDMLLVALALRLATTLRASDTAARLGGDRFAVLVRDSVTPGDVETVAERITDLFTEPFPLDGLGTERVTVLVEVSVGIATTEDSLDTAELLGNADLALREAKAAGKAGWRRHRPTPLDGLSPTDWLQGERGLARALENTEFSVLYQPIVRLADDSLVGFEALVRWPGTSQGPEFPDQFLPLAEQSGQILPLGAWVLDQVTAEIARWADDSAATGARAGRRDSGGCRPPYASVNASARQLRDPGFTDTVRRSLDRARIAPASLVVELPESALRRGDHRVASCLEALAGLGVRIAIDDFGTGYASLGFLRDLPVSVLKIDRSFIDQLGHSPEQYSLVEGVVAMAESLGVEVVAKGVENASQQLLLLSMGCPLGQGFWFSTPLAADRAAAVAAEGTVGVTNWTRDERGPSRPTS
ncbi:putative bifunctional diguanylate cyclase/phosphodiesterase [Kitasatospora sp. McL0602]|uniref:putative bifunctional diguanylate cyclase/phosphodiesterase n=1 Tax=Kitasatospora sp. McL0602 TaxID=3439530 RepID=UPI003F8BB9E2